MLNRLFAAILRLQRAVVVIELALAATYIAVDVPRGGEIGKALFPWTGGIFAVAGLSALWVLALTVLARAVWVGFGVRLRPDGVVDRRLVGSLFVPWEALAAEIPPMSARRSQVVLAYRDPRLVQSFGIGKSGNVITAGNVDNRFLARAIQEYVRHPEYRSAIGTPAELHRLHAAAG